MQHEHEFSRLYIKKIVLIFMLILDHNYGLLNQTIAQEQRTELNF